ncbi:GFA family protein [Rhizobium laguerreae]|uniref:GFA family protein n=1 Tax=Rhizobium laguerreae TaxID=1076926 RepID=UPI001C92691D|nr:GFA family protein [Rhizobium laguerreae]
MEGIKGHCLCGEVKYEIFSEPNFPHLCSCHTCQRWAGAPIVAWAEFDRNSIKWVGRSGEPNWYRSSESTIRGSCRRCGSGICAVDDGSDSISIAICTLDDPSLLNPDEQHSFKEEAPSWCTTISKN